LALFVYFCAIQNGISLLFSISAPGRIVAGGHRWRRACTWNASVVPAGWHKSAPARSARSADSTDWPTDSRPAPIGGRCRVCVCVGVGVGMGAPLQTITSRLQFSSPSPLLLRALCVGLRVRVCFPRGALVAAPLSHDETAAPIKQCEDPIINLNNLTDASKIAATQRQQQQQRRLRKERRRRTHALACSIRAISRPSRRPPSSFLACQRPPPCAAGSRVPVCARDVVTLTQMDSSGSFGQTDSSS
jgi:hypothetical protein